MNMKFEAFKKTIEGKLTDLIRKVVMLIINPLARFVEAKREKRRDYNLAMTEEELMRRFAKHVIKDMVRSRQRIAAFVYCEDYGIYVDRDCYFFILYKLKNLHSTRDKYLAHYWKDVHLSSMADNEIVEMEKRLNLLLKNELEKMGIETYYKVESGFTDSWMSRTKYVHTLFVKLS